MSIEKLQCGVSTTNQMTTAVNALIDQGESLKINSSLRAQSFFVGCVGDSRLANSYAVSGKDKRYVNQMTISWLRALSLQRVEILREFDLAVSGSTTSQILSQAQTMSAMSNKPNLCLVNGGTNDFSASATAEAVVNAFNNLTSAVVLLLQSGITPVIEVDVPRTTASWTANANKCSARLNTMLRQWSSDNNVLLSDVESAYIDPATGEPGTNYNISDGIHPGSTGSSIRALYFLNAMSSLLSKHTSRQASPRDNYDVTLNPNGNMLSNGLFTGTAGTNSGAGATGVVADGWINRIQYGSMTATASKLPPLQAGLASQRQQVELSFINSAGYALIPSGIGGGATLPSGISAGDLIYAELDLVITELTGAVSEVALYLSDLDSGSTVISQSFDMKRNLWPGNQMPAVPLVAPNGAGNVYDTLTMRLKTPPMQFSDGVTATQILCRLVVLGEAGSAITIQASNAQLRKL